MVVSTYRLTELCQHIMLATWDRDLPDDLGRAYDAACMLREEIAAGSGPSSARVEQICLWLELAWSRYEVAVVRQRRVISRMAAVTQARAA
jgi:hypothetical protein